VHGQKVKIPQGYFSSPVKHQVKLGGNFCELRNNHFHAGIDIKSSKGVPGDSLFAVAEGYISRVKVQRSSYGQTIYIDHPVGLTSVYAHMDQFAPTIAAFVKEAQYMKEQFEIDLHPDSSRFVVRKGQFIGFMGNKGHSFGPHLHFEIRTTKGEVPQNPMEYGFGPKDSRPPQFTAMKIAEIDHRGKPIKDQRYTLIKKAKNILGVKQDTIHVGAWRAGVEIGAFDRQDGTWNKNGVYQLMVMADGDTIFMFKADHCSFEETGQINAHINYKDRILRNQFIHRCYKLPGSTLTMYPVSINNGQIELYQNKARKIQVFASDLSGNKSQIVFYIKRKNDVEPVEGTPYHSLFMHDKNNIYSFGEMTINAPQGSLYHDVELSITAIDAIGRFSIGDPTVALRNKIELRLPSSYIPNGLKSKIHLNYFDPRRKKWKSMGRSEKDDNQVYRISHFGQFWPTIDTIAPYIKEVHVPKNIRGKDVCKFKIGDNTEVVSKVNDINYKVTLNGKWILAEFDAKNDLLTVELKPGMASGKSTLEVIVDDFCNNRKVLKKEIVFINIKS